MEVTTGLIISFFVAKTLLFLVGLLSVSIVIITLQFSVYLIKSIRKNIE